MSPTAASPQRSRWRLFPVAMISGLLLVVAVNAGMVWESLSTFPGVAETDVFDHSNHYDEVLAQAGREAAIGWTLVADIDAATPLLQLTDRDGKTVAGAQVAGTARRPVGPDQTTALEFVETAPGRYMASAGLPGRGQWDLRLTLTHGPLVVHATRRVLVK